MNKFITNITRITSIITIITGSISSNAAFASSLNPSLDSGSSSDLSYPNYNPAQNNLPVKTNINKVTNEFEAHIENKENFDLDINQGIESAKNSVAAPNISEMISPEDLQKLDFEKSRLSQIPARNLEAEGRGIRLNPQNSYMKDFEVDYTNPGSTSHKRDVDNIVDIIESKMGSLTLLLKENGIDCSGTYGPNELISPFVKEEIMQQKMVKDYRKMPCEHKQNLYDCKDIIKLRCSDKSHKSSSSLNFTSNLPISSDNTKGEITFGWPYNHSLNGGAGTQYDYNINFNIQEDVDEFGEFTLSEIGYDDFIRITVNERQIFAGPFGGDRLLLHHHHHPVHPISRFYTVQTSESEFHSAEQNTWFTSGGVNLKSYLKPGPNKIEIRLIVGDKGGIWLKLIAKITTCKAWQESWEEQCTHKK